MTALSTAFGALGTPAAAARHLLTRLSAALLGVTEGETVFLSIGAISFGPTGDDVDELLRQADEQMYRVKSEGKNGVSVEDRTPMVARPAVTRLASAR